MPIVMVNKKPCILGRNLRVICDEVITFALNTKQGPLQPGNTVVVINSSDMDSDIDVLIQVECCYFDDRYEKCDEKSSLIRDLVAKAYLDTRTGVFYPIEPAEIKVVVWVKYLDAAYAGPEEPNGPRVKMTKSAMLKRIMVRCGFSSN